MATKTNAGLATYGRPADAKYFSVAPFGTELPATSNAELNQAFESVRVSSDGITPSADLGKKDASKDWSGKPVLSAPAEPTASLDVPVIDHSATANKIKYGSANVSGGGVKFTGATDEWSVVVTELHNDEDGNPKSLVRTVYPRCGVKSLKLGSHKRGDLIVDTVSFEALDDGKGSGLFYLLPPVSVGA